MNHFLALLVVCTALTHVVSRADHPATGRDAPSDPIDALAREFNLLAQRWRDAYNSGDSTALTSMYAEDADYISGHVSGLVAHGRNQVITNFLNGIRLGGHVDSVSIISIEQSCDLASLLCRYEATNAGQKAAGRNLLVVKRIGNRWLIVMHVTVV